MDTVCKRLDLVLLQDADDALVKGKGLLGGNVPVPIPTRVCKFLSMLCLEFINHWLGKACEPILHCTLIGTFIQRISTAMYGWTQGGPVWISSRIG
jgi:hypothetical protein